MPDGSSAVELREEINELLQKIKMLEKQEADAVVNKEYTAAAQFSSEVDKARGELPQLQEREAELRLAAGKARATALQHTPRAPAVSAAQ